MTKDRLYAAPKPGVQDFQSGAATTGVFDMLQRWFPFYEEIQRMIGESGTACAACWR